ncbi:immunity 22 family protein [Bacteroides salyersiae]|nr:immunity 22 family protein [Bacteroides salyersiae]
MRKVHIWIGTFSGSKKEYEDYFNLQDSPCRFCIDIDADEFDEDFIGIIPLFNEEQDISVLLQEVPIDMDDIEDVLTSCKVMNIEKGNAVLYLTDVSLVVPNKEKNFNGLKYIGMYNSSL